MPLVISLRHCLQPPFPTIQQLICLHPYYDAFPECHNNGITAFEYCLFHLSQCIWGLFLLCGSEAHSFSLQTIILLYKCIMVVQPFTNWRICGCFQCRVIMLKAAMNILILVSMWTFFNLLGLLSCLVNIYLTLQKTAKPCSLLDISQS